jgi:2-polyprenyl-6-methoxyphenol hydroxylase-like FAD-dependent oxidoreductase
MSGSAIVVGAGVGGLTAAVALKRRGWDVRVYEKAYAIEAVGAGLALAPNALTALDAIGLGRAARDLSALQGEAGIRTRGGRWLSRTSAEAAEQRYGNPTIVLHRSALLGLLQDAVPDGAITLGAEVTLVEPEFGRVVLADGSVDLADVVVAADGLRSPIRGRIFPEHPGVAYAGVTSWRIVVPRPDAPVLPTESWGPGTVFGTAVLADGRVYCYATAVAPPGEKAADEKAELARRFAKFHAPIPALIDAADAVVRTDINALARPLGRLTKGKVALLGDAAHAMTPNLGQGACQAIEDAVVLAAYAERPGGLHLYSAERSRRTAMVAKRSQRITGLTRLTNPVAVAARDSGLWLAGKLGPNVVLKQMEPVFGWQPPDSPDGTTDRP